MRALACLAGFSFLFLAACFDDTSLAQEPGGTAGSAGNSGAAGAGGSGGSTAGSVGAGAGGSGGQAGSAGSGGSAGAGSGGSAGAGAGGSAGAAAGTGGMSGGAAGATAGTGGAAGEGGGGSAGQAPQYCSEPSTWRIGPKTKGGSDSELVTVQMVDGTAKILFLDRTVPVDQCNPPGNPKGEASGSMSWDGVCSLNAQWEERYCFSGEDQCLTQTYDLVITGDDATGTAKRVSGACAFDKQETSWAVTAKRLVE